MKLEKAVTLFGRIGNISVYSCDILLKDQVLVSWSVESCRELWGKGMRGKKKKPRRVCVCVCIYIYIYIYIYIHTHTHTWD